MQQGTYFDEAQRTLGHDDVATLRFAESGVDELESGGPANRNARDNYTITLEYGGISTTNCDISMSFTNTSGLAFCSVGGAYVAPNHFSVNSATIEFGQGFTWFFNAPPNTAPVLGSIGAQSLTEGDNLVVNITATDADPGDTLSYSTTGLPAYAGFVDNGDGTAVLTLSPSIGDAASVSMTVTVTDDAIAAATDSETFSIDVAALDSDGDGISDFDEINTYGTLPDNPDSDGDFIDDGVEINAGSDPLDNTVWPALADADLAPLGNPDGIINAADYQVAQRIVLGQVPATSLELAHGDVYPAGAPDGVIDTADLVLILQLVQAP